MGEYNWVMKEGAVPDVNINPEWEVIVGNVGRVYSGDEAGEARDTYLAYRQKRDRKSVV